MNKKMMLLILDGWGIGPVKERSAIAMAETPNFDKLVATYPHATLLTHGENVGLPEGQMGNSEVGHINIGAGRVIYQELARINKAVRDGELHAHPLLHEALREAVKRNASIHLMGLVSDGGVHSHIDHLMALCSLCQDMEIPNTFVHAFLDGRDTDPKSGLGYLTNLQEKIAGTNVQLATAIGRYYAMDRDNRWERTKKAYDLLVYGEGTETADIFADLQRSYDEGITDEFFEPHVAVADNAARIKDQDLVIFFNFRTDRPRQLTRVLTQEPVEEYELYPLNIDMITFARYDETFEGIDVLFEKDTVTHSLGEVVADAGLSQLRIAETEKYPHVSFFFSGGREVAFDKESRILVPSPKVATYDLEPEMSAREITQKLLDFVENNNPDFVCLNFANTDMVGHTGVFSAAVKAAETVDECLGKIIPMGLEKDYGFIIIADHGNSDYMINDDGSPNTAHTTNPVPVIYVANDAAGHSMQNGILADVAPTILYCMGIAPSKEMNGKVLLSK